MCVGLSAKVVSIKGGVAIVDAGGAKKTVSSELLTDLNPGDYVMVHAGFAIERLPEGQALADLEAWEEMEAALE